MGKLEGQLIWRLALPFSVMLFLAALQRPGLASDGDAGLILGLRPPIYDLGAMLLFIGYAAGQAPALWLWPRLGTSALLSLALSIGGLHAAIASLAPGAESYWLLRFMQGVFQAGMGLAVILTLAEMAPQRLWGRLLILPLAAAPLAMAASPFLIQALNAFDPPLMPAWRWPMLATGVLTAVVGIFCSLIVWPAGGLDLAQVEQLRSIREEEARAAVGTSLIDHAPADLRTFLWAAAALALSLGAGGIGLVERILRVLSEGTIPSWGVWVALAAGLAVSGAASDRLGYRYWHVGLFALLASGTLFGGVMPGEPAPLRIWLLIASIFSTGGAMGSFWPIALRRLNRRARPLGIAIIGAAAALGSALAAPLIALSRIGQGSLALPVLLLANVLFLGAAMMLCAASFDMRFDLQRRV